MHAAELHRSGLLRRDSSQRVCGNHLCLSSACSTVRRISSFTVATSNGPPLPITRDMQPILARAWTSLERKTSGERDAAQIRRAELALLCWIAAAACWNAHANGGDDDEERVVVVVEAVREADLDGCMAEQIWNRSGREKAVRPLFRIENPIAGCGSGERLQPASPRLTSRCGLPHRLLSILV